MFGEPTTLIVVYKDELLINLFKKLVESNDDIDEENVVGIKDGSVRIVSWTEKVWLDQKKAGNINNKVLFLGKVKGWDKLLPIIDLKFNQHGVKYGWAGNQALLCADTDAIDEAEAYNSFLSDLSHYSVPESLKSEEVEVTEKKKQNFFERTGSLLKKNVLDPLSPEQRKKTRQLYFYGIQKFYENHLKEFVD